MMEKKTKKTDGEVFFFRRRRGEERTLEQVAGKILAGRKLSPEGRKIILSFHFLIYDCKQYCAYLCPRALVHHHNSTFRVSNSVAHLSSKWCELKTCDDVIK